MRFRIWEPVWWLVTNESLAEGSGGLDLVDPGVIGVCTNGSLQAILGYGKSNCLLADDGTFGELEEHRKSVGPSVDVEMTGTFMLSTAEEISDLSGDAYGLEFTLGEVGVLTGSVSIAPETEGRFGLPVITAEFGAGIGGTLTPPAEPFIITGFMSTAFARVF